MKKLFFIFTMVALVTAFQNVQAQNFSWVKQFGDTLTENGNSIIVDADGNVYTIGEFNSTADFDPGPDTLNFTSFGTLDVFITKLDASGNLVWAKQFGGTLGDAGNCITLDAARNVYFTGSFIGTADFDPGPATFNLTSAGVTDIVIIKLDVSGNLVWAKKCGGTESEEGRSISVDSFGNVYTTGIFSGTADFDPGPATFNLTSTLVTTSDAFITKLNASGNLVWAVRLGGTASDGARSLSTDVLGNVYTTGTFRGTADFDPSPATFNLISASANTSDVFITKLNASGNLVWAIRFGGTSNEVAYSLFIDPLGNMYVTGNFFGTADFDPSSATFNLTSLGNADIFISKLDTLGNLIWVKQFGGTAGEVAYSIVADAAGNVYATGLFNGTIDLDPGAGTFNITSFGSQDVFIINLDALGNLTWGKQFGGTGYEDAMSVCIDAPGNVYATGSFWGTADFDPGPNTYNLTPANSFGDSDVFILKLTPSAASLTVSINTIDATCYGLADGQATVSVNGGLAPYQYAWSNGATSATISNLLAGGYSVTVTDSAGTVLTDSVTVFEPAVLSATHNSTDINCYGESNGSASIIVTGGTTPYTYQWSSGQTTPAISGIPQGVYTIDVLDSNGCLLTDSVSIFEPSLLQASITSHTDMLCYGNGTGTATANGTGGTPPYTYEWSNTSGFQTATSLNAGTYSVTVWDAHLCSATTSSVTITEPAQLTTTISTQSSVSCFGDNDAAAKANPAGGVSPYTAEWSNGQTGFTANDLSAGNYQVTVTDSNGCTLVTSVTIQDGYQINAGAISGADSADINITATYSVDTGLNYLWSVSNGAIISGQGTNTIEVDWNTIGQGIIEVAVTDSGCTQAISKTITLIDLTGIESYTLQNLEVSPNPTNNTLTITAPAINAPATLILFDALGKEVLNQTAQPQELGKGVVLDVQELNGGVYFLSIRTAAGSRVMKVMKN